VTGEGTTVGSGMLPKGKSVDTSRNSKMYVKVLED
jgi:hypothetical protein